MLHLPCGTQFPDVSSRAREIVGCYSRGEIDEGTGVTGSYVNELVEGRDHLVERVASPY